MLPGLALLLESPVPLLYLALSQLAHIFIGLLSVISVDYSGKLLIKTLEAAPDASKGPR